MIRGRVTANTRARHIQRHPPVRLFSQAHSIELSLRESGPCAAATGSTSRAPRTDGPTPKHDGHSQLVLQPAAAAAVVRRSGGQGRRQQSTGSQAPSRAGPQARGAARGPRDVHLCHGLLLGEVWHSPGPPPCNAPLQPNNTPFSATTHPIHPTAPLASGGAPARRSTRNRKKGMEGSVTLFFCWLLQPFCVLCRMYGGLIERVTPVRRRRCSHRAMAAPALRHPLARPDRCFVWKIRPRARPK